MLRLLFFLLLGISVKAQSVYKTPSGEKYHLATCRMVKNTSEKITLEQAVLLGLTPCKLCAPPTAPAQSLPDKQPQGQQPATVQCKGFTKSGTRCRHMTKIANGYCYQHQPG